MLWKRVVLGVLIAVGLCLGLVTGVSAQDTMTGAMTDVVRYPIPGSDFPISQAVELPADATLVYLSGQVPAVVDETAEGGTIAAFGNTETQTLTVLEKIQDILTSLDLTMSDVVKMQVFLVGDPEMDGVMDFAGFMSGYTQFFGTEAQPNLPSRSAMQVAGLANPGWLVEIEVVAVR
ncbi:Endoribonuclease L-PSP superfamily [Synechococcus sp. PCC 7335]|uniref:RidA family protein n=1 Tax=Synechococcus sp. (strain ATCC 29403 / PCC 7335) TaxID=91464 RepID=UPI00017EE78F|nr:RidA family protein [Synechococcus sp. PCC 7335]EDX84897.1 Endoribonuclease L-PSP superfamily [Synechococcus sp. PCC 7335]